MYNWLTIFLFGALIALLPPLKTSAQTDTSARLFSINPYTGVGVADGNIKIGLLFQRGDAKLVGLPVSFGIKGEYAHSSLLGVKMDLNFVHRGVSYINEKDSVEPGKPNEEFHRRTSTKFRAMVGLNIYFDNTVKIKNYFTINFGLKYVSRRYTIDDKNADLFYELPLFTLNRSNEFFNPTMRIGLGIKRQISPHLYVTGEFGIGSTPLQLGVALKL